MNYEAGRLLGATMSDGYIAKDATGHYMRFGYVNMRRELLDDICNVARKLFGERLRIYSSRNSEVHIGGSLVASLLVSLGSYVGRKASGNPGIPWLVKYGSQDVRRGYFAQVFSDEATPSINRRKNVNIILTRSFRLKGLQKDHLELLEKIVSPLMKERTLPSGRRIKFVKTKVAIDSLLNYAENDPKKTSLINELIETSLSKPALLKDEAEILRVNFGMKPSIRPYELYRYKRAEYGLSCRLELYRKHYVLRFYNKIGFVCSRKQNMLKSFLNEFGWLENQTYKH
jgi:hypothetical protein